MSTPSSAKPSAPQPPTVQPPAVAATSAARPAKTTRPLFGAAKKTIYAIAPAAIVVLIAVAVGRPREAGREEIAVPSQPTSAERDAADLVSSAPSVVVSAPSQASTAAAPTVSPKKRASAATHAATPSPALASLAPSVEAPRSEEPASTRVEVEAAPTAPAAGSAVATTAFAPVTITGCLEVSENEDRFRLTDTEGGAAPKARSWRTGFLKKRSAAVDLARPDGLVLDKQVGKRIAATGVLTDRTLKVDSVRVVSPSCD